MVLDLGTFVFISVKKKKNKKKKDKLTHSRFNSISTPRNYKSTLNYIFITSANDRIKIEIDVARIESQHPPREPSTKNREYISTYIFTQACKGGHLENRRIRDT